jgi:hypothetical protein
MRSSAFALKRGCSHTVIMSCQAGKKIQDTKSLIHDPTKDLLRFKIGIPRSWILINIKYAD